VEAPPPAVTKSEIDTQQSQTSKFKSVTKSAIKRSNQRRNKDDIVQQLGMQVDDDNKSNSPSDESDNEIVDDAEDHCFICGEDRELLLCDFPQCKKVYHQVCVLERLPRPLTMLDKNNEAGQQGKHFEVS
jgi:hypothetical protein